MPKSNITENLSALEGVIWDLDNTLYRFEGDFEHLCTIAAAKAAIKSGLDMNYEEAFALCWRSYEEHGHSYHLVMEEYQLDRRAMHFDFHSFIDEKLIAGSIELVKLFERAPLKHVLVTHASRDWAHRALEHLGLAPFFPASHIIPAEDTDFSKKSQSKLPFEMALGLIDLPPEKVLVVEDLQHNLSIPHEMGLGTVLVHYGQRPEPMPDYIHLDCNNAIEFLEAVMREKDEGAYSASG